MARTSFGAMAISFASIGVAVATAMAIAGGDIGQAGGSRQRARSAATTMEIGDPALPASREARSVAGSGVAGPSLPPGSYQSVRLRAGEVPAPR